MPALTTLAREQMICPKCGANPGEPCRTPRGRKAAVSHGERVCELQRVMPMAAQACQVRSFSWSEMVALANGRQFSQR